MAAVGIGGVVFHSELKLKPLSLSIRLKKQWNSRTIYGSFAHDLFVGVGDDIVLGKKLGEGSFASVYRVSLARKPSSKGADLMQSREFPYNHLRHCSSSAFENAGRRHQIQVQRNCDFRVKALPNWPLIAVLVEHIEGQRDLITHKSVWHLSDEAMKNVYTFYIMFTVWGCCFFGSTKDPYYDSEQYRGDGGDGTGHWVYEKQEDIEETARAELWREELIEEIEQKIGGLRELEEAGKKEQLVK